MTCYWPACGKPAARKVGVGDDAGSREQPICEEHYQKYFEE